MECIEARALKSSCFSRFSMLPSNLPTTNFPGGNGDDDFWCVAGINSDDFSVDEFFDLPADEQGQKSLLDTEDEEKAHSSTVSLSSSSHVLNRHHHRLDDGRSNSSSAQLQDLPFPVCPLTSDMEELELWSQLMDDSVSEEISLADPILKSGSHVMGRSEPDKNPVGVGGRTLWIPAAFPVRPRSGFTRKNRLQVRHSGGGSTSSAESAAGGTGTTSLVNGVHGRSPVFEIPEREKKKQRKSMPVQQRRCTHCQAQRTPQWRAGPLGPKTLCNACGVRFKKGRLYPEYRPACSPTFSSGMHSNSHRKVMEMRREEEMATRMIGPVEGRSGSTAEGML